MNLSTRLEKISADFNDGWGEDLPGYKDEIIAFIQERIKEEVAHAFEVTGVEKVPLDALGWSEGRAKAWNSAIEEAERRRNEWIDV